MKGFSQKGLSPHPPAQSSIPFSATALCTLGPDGHNYSCELPLGPRGFCVLYVLRPKTQKKAKQMKRRFPRYSLGNCTSPELRSTCACISARLLSARCVPPSALGPRDTAGHNTGKSHASGGKRQQMLRNTSKGMRGYSDGGWALIRVPKGHPPWGRG